MIIFAWQQWNRSLIYKGKDNVVTVPSAGIYLVHVADKTRKIVGE